MAFVLLAGLAAHLAFSWMGFAAMDDGYVLAASRRVLAGQVPYRDFIWIHGPASLWLFAPVAQWGGEWTFWISRGVSWFQFAAIGWSWMALAERVAGRSWSSGHRWLVAAAATAHAAHTFPAMAWCSVDAVWSASAGFALAARGTRMARLLGFALVGLSPLFRQNFAPLIPAALLVLGGWRSPACWTAALAPGALTALALAGAGALTPAFAQMGASPDFVKLAVHPYVYLQPWFPPAVLAGFVSAWGAVRALRTAGRAAGRAALVALVLLACGWLVRRDGVAPSAFFLWWAAAGALAALRPEAGDRPLRAGGWLLGACLVLFALPPFHAWELAGYAVAAGWSYRVFVCGRRGPAAAGWPDRIGALALLTGWCVSISMGYNHPALGSAGPVAFLLAIASRPGRTGGSRASAAWPLAVAAAATLAAFGFARTRYIYFQPPARFLRAPLGEVLAGGRGIRTDAATYDFLADLRRAVARADGSCCIVLPDLAAHWVRSPSLNPLPADWAAGVEMRDPALLAPLLRALESRRGGCLVIYQKFTAAYISGTLQTMDANGYRVLADRVRKRFRRVGETDWFVLYR